MCHPLLADIDAVGLLRFLTGLLLQSPSLGESRKGADQSGEIVVSAEVEVSITFLFVHRYERRACVMNI